MKPIVHIGYHKTGTNWFQRHLYPHAASHRYIQRPVVRKAFLDLNAFEFKAATARQLIDNEAKELAPILCEEELSGNIHTGGLAGNLSKDMAHRLHSAFADATVVIFIRNQVNMIASTYKQYIKEGGTHGVNRYLAPRRYLSNSGFRQAKAPYFTFDHFEYLPLIRHYRNVFGEENVKVYPFEAFTRDNQGFAKRYAAELELDIDWGRVQYQQANPPYQRVPLLLARVLNHFTLRDVADKHYLLNIPGFYRIRGKLMRGLNKLPIAGGQVSSEKLLGKRWIGYIIDRFAESNQQLAAETGLDLAEFGYPIVRD